MTEGLTAPSGIPAEAEVKYCQRCGVPMTWQPRFGRPRPVCPSCDWTYFPDPKVAAAVLVERDGQVLLVRRANDPERGKWTLPAGFIDAGEDPVNAAERECLEETGLLVRVSGLLDVLYGQEHPRGAHIVIFYRAEILTGSPHPGDDVDRVDFFRRDRLPPLAFDTTRKVLLPKSS
jgi:ADP-ribose pyrophosphatase YjhB (NUDIX family)